MTHQIRRNQIDPKYTNLDFFVTSVSASDWVAGDARAVLFTRYLSKRLLLRGLRRSGTETTLMLELDLISRAATAVSIDTGCYFAPESASGRCGSG